MPELLEISRLAPGARRGNKGALAAAPRSVIGLGANLGDKLATLEAALSELAHLGDLEAVSRLYETAPVGGPVQPDYYNAAVCIRSELQPGALLQKLLEIERNHGRIRVCRWGPRELDLDILWIEGTNVDEAGLRVPHARLLERNFALVPLVEVAPDARDPNSGLEYRCHPNSKQAEGMRLRGVVGELAGARNGQRSVLARWTPCR